MKKQFIRPVVLIYTFADEYDILATSIIGVDNAKNWNSVWGSNNFEEGGQF